jgi:hypothetical protein
MGRPVAVHVDVSLDAIRPAAAWWMEQGWITAGPARMLKRRKPRPDRARALSQAEVEQMLTRENISLRERTLWRMLYEQPPGRPRCSRSTWSQTMEASGEPRIPTRGGRSGERHR